MIDDGGALVIAGPRCDEEPIAHRAERVIRELRRELSARRRLFPVFIKQRKLPPEVASERMRDLEDALEDLLALYRERLRKAELAL